MSKKCGPCEGGVTPYSKDQSESQLSNLDGWKLSDDGKRIRKKIMVDNFLHGLEVFQRIGVIAESQGHHPDLHLEGYCNVIIELWTHSIGGLSENDFIMAAKIDQLEIS